MNDFYYNPYAECNYEIFPRLQNEVDRIAACGSIITMK